MSFEQVTQWSPENGVINTETCEKYFYKNDQKDATL
jgi:hypothetical protein